jgi:PAS domain S-box-containing protein
MPLRGPSAPRRVLEPPLIAGARGLDRLSARPTSPILGGLSLPTQLSPHLGRALEQINVPSYVLDRNGRVRWLNAAAKALVGDARGRSFTSLIAPEDVERARARFADRLRGAPVQDFAVDLITITGGRARVEISSVALQASSDHHAIGVFGLVVRSGGAEPAGGHAEHRLTPRQAQVLRLLARGASTEQIADALHLSRETVRNHVRHVLRALGARSRLEAVAIAHREGLVTSPS